MLMPIFYGDEIPGVPRWVTPTNKGEGGDRLPPGLVAIIIAHKYSPLYFGGAGSFDRLDCCPNLKEKFKVQKTF